MNEYVDFSFWYRCVTKKEIKTTVLTFLENSALQNPSASSRFKPTPYTYYRE
jgi:hypothetical protein